MVRERIGNVTLIAAAMAGAAVFSSAAATTGTLTVNGRKTALSTAVAYAYPSVMGKGKNISVLVSDKAPQEKAFRQLLAIGPGEKLLPGLFEGAWKSMHFEKAFSGLALTFGPDRKLLSNEVLVGGQSNAFSISSDDVIVDLKEFGPRIAGTIRTAKTIDAGSVKYAIDVTLDAAVVDFK